MSFRYRVEPDEPFGGAAELIGGNAYVGDGIRGVWGVIEIIRFEIGLDIK